MKHNDIVENLFCSIIYEMRKNLLQFFSKRLISWTQLSCFPILFHLERDRFFLSSRCVLPQASMSGVEFAECHFFLNDNDVLLFKSKRLMEQIYIIVSPTIFKPGFIISDNTENCKYPLRAKILSRATILRLFIL